MDYQKNHERLKKSLIKSIKEMITPFVDSFGGELVLTDSPYIWPYQANTVQLI